MKHGFGYFRRNLASGLLALFTTLSWGGNAFAFPGVFAAKDGAQRVSRSTQVAIMKNGDARVVSVMTDYEGPMQPFMMVLPVPADVKLEEVKVLKRGDLERLEQLTAPRFHEFWEMDPCEEGEQEQIWERSLVASSNTDFLGGTDMFKNTEKVPKEMKLKVEPTFRDDGEYKLALVKDNVEKWLSGKGHKLPAGAAEKLDGYQAQGQQFLVAEVDPRRVELGPKGNALLSPIRFATRQDVKLASTLGLLHAQGKQELLVYVLDLEDRYEVANYPNVFPPTNVRVDFQVKERMGDFYANVHDKLLEKDEKAFLIEYAWKTTECGQPCPNAAMHLSELLTLGADVFEQALPDEIRNPEPPERTEEQEELYKKAKKEEKQRLDKLAKELVRRQGLIKRQGEYVLTRLHHRYDSKGLTKDVEFKPAKPLERGIEVPQGELGTLAGGEKPAEQNRIQTRYYFLHPNKAVVNCENPQSFRWGKPPRSYRGARKIWVADNLATRDRKRTQAQELVWSDVPALGLKSQLPTEKPAAGAAAEEKKAEEGGCNAARQRVSSGGVGALGLLAFGLLWRRRQRR